MTVKILLTIDFDADGVDNPVDRIISELADLIPTVIGDGEIFIDTITFDVKE